MHGEMLTHAYCDAHPDYTYANSNGDSGFSVAHPDGDGHADTDAYANGHAETYTDAKA